MILNLFKPRLITLPLSGRKVWVGMRPTPRNILAKARWAGGSKRFLALPPPPPNLNNCVGITDFSMEGNDQYGDCVSAEEAAAKRVISVCTKAPEVVIPD